MVLRALGALGARVWLLEAPGWCWRRAGVRETKRGVLGPLNEVTWILLSSLRERAEGQTNPKKGMVIMSALPDPPI